MAFPPLKYPHGTASGQIGHLAQISYANTPSSTGGRLVGWGEDGTSAIVNRSNWALSTNINQLKGYVDVLYSGVQGFQADPFGAQGFQGLDGTQGVTGAPSGFRGSQGVQGFIGSQGAQGIIPTNLPFRFSQFVGGPQSTSSTSYSDLHTYTFTTSASTNYIFVETDFHGSNAYIELYIASSIYSTLVPYIGVHGVAFIHYMAVSANTSYTIKIRWRSGGSGTGRLDATNAFITVQELAL